MTTEISQRELRNNSGEIMRQLEAGESFVVTRSGAPVGELLPLHRRKFVNTATATAIFRNSDPVDLDRLRSDLDSVADQDVEPRA